MEEPLAEVVRLAVAELNTAQPGKPPGVGGREVKMVTADGLVAHYLCLGNPSSGAG